MSTLGALSAESLLNNLGERVGNRLQEGSPGGVLLTMNTYMASGISENLNVMTGTTAPQREGLFASHTLGLVLWSQRWQNTESSKGSLDTADPKQDSAHKPQSSCPHPTPPGAAAIVAAMSPPPCPHSLFPELWVLLLNPKFICSCLFHSSTPNPLVASHILGCCRSVAQSCLTLCDPVLQASLSFTISQSLLKLMPIESVMPSNHLILCHPLLLLPSIFPSIRVFSNESALHIRWPKYWSFSFSISPSKEYSGLIFFRINWFDLLVVQGTLKSVSIRPRSPHHGLPVLNDLASDIIPTFAPAPSLAPSAADPLASLLCF